MDESSNFAGIAWMQAGMRGRPRILTSLKSLALERFVLKRDDGLE